MCFVDTQTLLLMKWISMVMWFIWHPWTCLLRWFVSRLISFHLKDLLSFSLFVLMRCCLLFRMCTRKIKRKLLIMYLKTILRQLSLSDQFPVSLMQSVWKHWSIKSPQELMMKSHQLFLIQVLTNPRERYRFGSQSYISCYWHYLFDFLLDFLFLLLLYRLSTTLLKRVLSS